MEPTLILQLAIAALAQLQIYLLFGRFVVPRRKAVGKLAFYFLISGILANALGWWGLIWIIGYPVLSSAAHVFWCRNHGIDWLTCQPREEYVRLQPWAP